MPRPGHIGTVETTDNACKEIHQDTRNIKTVEAYILTKYSCLPGSILFLRPKIFYRRLLREVYLLMVSLWIDIRGELIVNRMKSCIGYLLGIVDGLLENINIIVTAASISCVADLDIDCARCWISS